MLDFFSACVESQPGFIQLLIGAKNVQVIDVNAEKEKAARDLTKGKKEQNESLVSSSGCLDPILRLLKKPKGKNLDKLHLATVNFVLSLWMHNRVVAISHLKTSNNFWKDLTWPLFEQPNAAAGPKGVISAGIFRIISTETYVCGGKVDDGLMAVLEKFAEEKNDYFKLWCNVVLDSAGEAATDSANGTSTFGTLCGNDTSPHVLLAAWKSFLVVLTKDQPVTVSPDQCHAVSSKLIRTIKRLVSPTDHGDCDDEARVLTSLSEFYLILMQRWHTKCADSMEKWCVEQAELLEQVLYYYDGHLLQIHHLNLAYFISN